MQNSLGKIFYVYKIKMFSLTFTGNFAVYGNCIRFIVVTMQYKFVHTMNLFYTGM